MYNCYSYIRYYVNQKGDIKMLRIDKPINKEKLTEENILEFYNSVCHLSDNENDCIKIYHTIIDDMIQIILYRDLLANLKQQFTIYIYTKENHTDFECNVQNVISHQMLDFTPVLISDYQCRIFF